MRKLGPETKTRQSIYLVACGIGLRLGFGTRISSEQFSLLWLMVILGISHPIGEEAERFFVGAVHERVITGPPADVSSHRGRGHNFGECLVRFLSRPR